MNLHTKMDLTYSKHNLCSFSMSYSCQLLCMTVIIECWFIGNSDFGLLCVPTPLQRPIRHTMTTPANK